MLSIRRCELPLNALIQPYGRSGDYIDCYTTVIRGAISHAQFVETFYTTTVFKLERLLLSWLIAKPSTDDEARKLAGGELHAFSAWTVEGRIEDQLLMCDFQSRTRSWLMVAQEDWEGDLVTRLYFGSVIVCDVYESGKPELNIVFKLLLPFHKVYSRVLLLAARATLKKMCKRKCH